MREVMREGKNAVVAAILSFLIPGVGQLYAGSVGKGIAFLVVLLFGWGFTSTLIGALLGIPMLIVVYIGSPIDAYMVVNAMAKQTPPHG